MALGYVRPARPGDATEITRIQLTTWRTAYRRLLPRHVLDGLDEAWMAQCWREAIEAPPSGAHRVLVAIEQSAQSYLVGFAAVGPAGAEFLAPGEPAPPDWPAPEAPPAAPDGASPPPDVPTAQASPAGIAPGTAGITDLLVEPRWGRRGHGSRLLAACVDGWLADGFHTALAWAYEGDTATMKFLTGAGWEPDGASRALDVDDLLVPQVRLHVALPEPGEPVAPPEPERSVPPDPAVPPQRGRQAPPER